MAESINPEMCVITGYWQGKEELRKPVPGDVFHYCVDSWLWFSETGRISLLVR